jgi:hypothetical protein
MSKLPRVIAVILIVAGGVQIAAGIATYFVVQHELSQERITVSSDADHFAGDQVNGPFTAYSQAEVIKKHADAIADGKTYAELDQNDPRREQVMTASFLRASLFTSVVAFGVAALVVGLGLLWVLLGIALLGVERQVKRLQPALAGTAPVVAAPIAPVETAPPAAPAPVAPVETAPPAAPVETAPVETTRPADEPPPAPSQ